MYCNILVYIAMYVYKIDVKILFLTGVQRFRKGPFSGMIVSYSKPGPCSKQISGRDWTLLLRTYLSFIALDLNTLYHLLFIQTTTAHPVTASACGWWHPVSEIILTKYQDKLDQTRQLWAFIVSILTTFSSHTNVLSCST